MPNTGREESYRRSCAKRSRLTTVLICYLAFYVCWKYNAEDGRRSVVLLHQTAVISSDRLITNDEDDDDDTL